MRTLSLKRTSVPKVAVLAAGLVAAFLVATIHPAPIAQAFPSKQQECLNCHGVGTPAGTVNAVPSTTTPAAGATYTVVVTHPANANEPAGDTGYWIANSTAAGATGTTTGVYGGNDGTGAATRTATMTAPAAAGTYYYKVWAVKGSTATTGVTNFKVYSITVAGAPVVVTTTTALAVTPASPVVAPASPSLKATVTGTGAVGLVEFFNGTTSLGTSPVAAGTATKALTGVVAGSYSYKAVFTPTDAALFTPSTSLVVAYVVTAAPPVVVTTTTALAVTPASPVVAPASPSLKATVTGAGAVGLVEFFNGTTSLGTSPVAAGTATKALTGVVAGSYSYRAVFTPTDAALFTPSTSSVVAYLVNAVVSAPTANFTASAISGPAPLAVTFADTSTGAPTSWLWTFGNGSTSNVQSPPVVTYTAAGTYTVTLIASNAGGAGAAVTKTITVTVPSPVVVTTTTALAVSPASPVVEPASPTLTATVTGSGAAGTVEFFNGTTSLGTSPVAAGTATKALTGVVAGSYSYKAVFTPTDAALFTPSTSTVVAYVVTAVVPAPVPVASFTASATSGVFPLPVTLTDTSTNAPISWAWNLGDGTTSTVQNPSVTYAAAGTYTVSLVATNVNGASTAATQVITVTTTVPPTTATARITKVSPDEAPVGAIVTVKGTDFGTAGVVKFGTVTAKVWSWTSTKIVVTVPAVSRDEVEVTVTPLGGVASNGVEFEVKGVHHYGWDD